MPVSWQQTRLVQLYKGKGSRKCLDNMRHIHIKSDFSKFFGHIVVSAAKDDILKNMSKYQIATKPGHRPQELLYILKSVIALYNMLGKAIIIQMWDLSKFFDKESLTDCLNELYKSNIKGKLYRLLYSMNRNTKISVDTPVGLTYETDRGEGVGQGTLEGALVSAANLDSGVRDCFQNSEHEVSYGGLGLGPIMYQDDVSRLADSIEAAQAGNDRMLT